MQKFCTHDGGRLVPDFEQAKPFDPNATVHADLSNLDIPVTPPAPRSPAPAPDLNATIAGAQPPPPPAPQPTPPQPQTPPTSNIRAPETGPTSFPQTTRLTPPSAPPQQPNYPPPPVQQPQQPRPPASPPKASQQMPTLSGPPPTPSGGFPSSSAGAPNQSAGTPNQSAGLPSPSAGAPISSAALPTSSAPLPGSSAALPTGSAQLPSQSAPLPSQSASAPLPYAPLVTPKKKSKVGLVLALVAVLLLLIVAVGGTGAYFYFKRSKAVESNANNGGVTVNQTLDNNSNTNNNSTTTTTGGPTLKPKVEVPPNSVKFENSASNLDGKLAEHYVDFYFYYPQTWQKSAKAGVPGAANFAEVERFIPPDFTQEKLVVGYYLSNGTVEADLAGKLPDVIKEQDAKLAKFYPEYQKVSEGKTTINGIDGYEFRFKAMSRNTDKGDITFWGRVVFLPPGDEQSNKGVTLYMLTTSLAPELQSVDDVGVKGELPVILNSFTLGKS
jgi:flagellar basal body-associated protein FliL